MQQVCHCRNCNEELFLYFTKAGSKQFRISSNCPFCKDKSFKPLVSGYTVDEKRLKVANVKDDGEELWLELVTTTTTGT